MNRNRSFAYKYVRNITGMIGLVGVVIILIAGLFGPMFFEYPEGYNPEILLSPSASHPLGTDNLGLDILSQLIWGARTSIYVSFFAVLVALAIGIPVGLFCGYSRSSASHILDGIIDIFLTLPQLPLQIITAAIVGPSITTVAVIIGIFSWPSLARVTKNAALKARNMQYIEAAEGLGYSRGRIMFRHLLVNITGPITVNATMVLALAVISESSLSFLGLGDPTTWSWGLVLKRSWSNNAVISSPNPWWWWISPSICITIFVISFNMIGTAINDIFSPKGQD